MVKHNGGSIMLWGWSELVIKWMEINKRHSWSKTGSRQKIIQTGVLKMQTEQQGNGLVKVQTLIKPTYY